MSRYDAGSHAGRSGERSSSADGVIAVLLLVLAAGAMAPFVGGRDVTAAEAPRASSWPRVLHAGHAARARGDAPSARRAYLIALFRARGERSLIGMLGAAEGFKALGDGEVVEQALVMAAAARCPALRRGVSSC